MKIKMRIMPGTLVIVLSLLTALGNAQPQADRSISGPATATGLDPAFGLAGKVITDFGFDRDAQALAIAIQSDGRIVAAGRASIPLNGFDFALARYNSDGSPDLGFGIGGRVTTDFFGGNDRATAVVVQSDGKIIVGGDAFNTLTGNTDFAIARYNSDGSPDASFDGDGKLTTDLSVSDVANALILQPDGKIVLAGSVVDSKLSKDFALLRYNSDGTPDAGFGAKGVVLTDFANNSDDIAAAILKADGSIIAVGFAAMGTTGKDFAIAQYDRGGSHDSTFGVGGKATIDFFGSTDEARAVTLQPDGRIVVAGSAFNGSTLADFALVRFNADGTIDSNFGSKGRVTVNFFDNLDAAEAVIVLSDGRIVAAGRAFRSGTDSDFALASFKPNGKPDASFGGSGKLTTDFDGGVDQALDIAIDLKGRLVVAGSAVGANFSADFAIARYLLRGNSLSADREVPE
ncbi:MAG TPA: hypothetical protein VKN18_01910 [Blastocatellia bacterium]|nr:hypothetical protein [Blastocatellia bacterium]